MGFKDRIDPVEESPRGCLYWAMGAIILIFLCFVALVR
jgi:hypothetical protein